MTHFRFGLAAGLSAALMLAACEREEPEPLAPPEPNVFQIITTLTDFQASHTVAAGWITFRYTNNSQMPHFALVEDLPEGITIEDVESVTAPLFQDGMDLILEGRPEDAAAKFAELPEWFGEVVFTGGPGLTSGGQSSEATIYLEPGTYLLECYVKSNGVFHSMTGMLHQFTVTEGTEGAPPQEAPALEVTLSNDRGIEVAGVPAPGVHLVKVRFESQRVHENFVGTDVHLARLGEDADLEALAAWMDWSAPEGLDTAHAPQGVTFLGGINDMPAGATGYFKATLAPGRYAWIAEVPSPREKGLLEVFTVEGAPEAE